MTLERSNILIKKVKDTMNWNYLSWNPRAILIQEKSQDKFYWEFQY